MTGLLSFFGGAGEAAADIAKRQQERNFAEMQAKAAKDFAVQQSDKDWQRRQVEHQSDQSLVDARRTEDRANTLADQSASEQRTIDAEQRQLDPARIEQLQKYRLLESRKLAEQTADLGTQTKIKQANNPDYIKAVSDLDMAGNAAYLEGNKMRSEGYAAGRSGTAKTSLIRPELSDLADGYAAQYKVDPSLIKGMISGESSGKDGQVSPAGAQGHMQLMPMMSKHYGVNNPQDPDQNINGGTHFIADLLGKYGDKKLALAAYNAGEPAIDKAIQKATAQGKDPSFENIKSFLPDETKNYVPKILARQAAISNEESRSKTTLAENKINATEENRAADKFDQYAKEVADRGVESGDAVSFDPEAALNLWHYKMATGSMTSNQAMQYAKKAVYDPKTGTYSIDGRKPFAIPTVRPQAEADFLNNVDAAKRKLGTNKRQDQNEING